MFSKTNLLIYIIYLFPSQDKFRRCCRRLCDRDGTVAVHCCGFPARCEVLATCAFDDHRPSNRSYRRPTSYNVRKPGSNRKPAVRAGIDARHRTFVPGWRLEAVRRPGASHPSRLPGRCRPADVPPGRRQLYPTVQDVRRTLLRSLSGNN